jgi:hypothetical protein
LNDTKINEGETVGVTIAHQRKGKNDQWENTDSIDLSTLKKGEGVKLKLNSQNTKKIYNHLTTLYTLVNGEGILSGTNEFTVAKADEIIKIGKDKDRKVIIESLLSENYGEEVWNELISSNPDLATKLALARVQTSRSKALVEFKRNLDSNNQSENFWQKFFAENHWIFGYGLNYQFLHLLKEQPNYGGENFTGKGSQRGDYLLNTAGDTQFTVLVEIKTPETKLLSYNNSGCIKLESIRNDVWLLSLELLGATSQIQVNCRTWNIDSQKAENVRELESKRIFTVEPKGILIIGNTKEFSKNESIASCFESYRRNIKNPEILTFDELYERAKFIVSNESAIQQKDECVISKDN